MADRVRQPDTAALLGRPDAQPVDSVAALAARNELQDFALQTRSGVVAPGSAVLPAVVGSFGNLIVDADFEGAALNGAWQLNSGGGGAIALTTAFAYNGLQSLQLSGGNSIATFGLDVPSQIPFLSINVGQAAYFSAYVMTDDVAGSQVSINIVFTDANGVITGGYRTASDQINLASGWVQIQAAARAPVGTVYYYVAVIYQSLTAAKNLYIDTTFLALTNTEGGPVATVPTDTGQRLEIEGSSIYGHTGHHLESTEGVVEFTTIQRAIGNAAQDQSLLRLLASLFGGAGPELDLYSASSDGSQKSTIELHSTIASVFGSLGLKGGLDASSFVLDIYQPANINPILTAAGTAANCGAQHTAFTITDRKMAILVLHFVTAATVNNTATSIQHVQAKVLTNTAGGAPATASTFEIPTSCVGTSIDRVTCVAGYINAGVQCSGAFNVLPQLGWTTTAVVGAGGVANLQTFTSTVITIAIPVT